MIRLDDIKYTPEISTQTVDHLLGNKGSKIIAEIDFTVLEYIRATATKKIEFGSNVFPTADYITSANNISMFSGLQKGDLIDISSTGSNNFSGVEIIEVVSDVAIRTDQAFTPEIDDDAVVTMVTPIEAIRYFFGIIENNESTNFLSKITGDTNQLQYSSYSTAALVQVNMEWSSPIETQIGSAILERLQTGVLTNQQRFRITHTFFVDPVTLASQYANAITGVAPPQLTDSKSFKHVFKISGHNDFSNPNLVHQLTHSQTLGNVGFKDENYNQGLTNYSVTNLQYFRDATNEEISSLELTTDDIRLEATIQNTLSAPFVDGGTIFVTNFSYAPENESEYQNNGKSVIENFFLDRAVQTVGSAAVNGERFSTDQQMIKEVTAIELAPFDGSVIKVIVIFQMATAAFNDISARTSRKSFDFNIEIQNHLQATELNDLVTLDVAVKQYFSDTSDPDMIASTTKFLQHYESDVDTEGSGILEAHAEDDILTYCQFTIDRTGRESDQILVNNVTASVIAKHIDGREIVLEQEVISFSNAQIDNTNTQFIDFNKSRVFQMPDDDQRKVISLKRRSDLDTGLLRYYDLKYPFLFRWDDFTSLAGVDNEFFDSGEENNGRNHQWNRYDTFADWSICFRLDVNTFKNGFSIVHTQTTSFDSFTYLESADWINETLTFFDGVVDITPNLLGYKDTRIEIEKEYAGAGAVPETIDVEWCVRIEVWKQGSLVGIRYLSSLYDWTQHSWLKSVDASNKVIKSKLGNVHKATFLIDHEKIIQQNFAEGTKLKVSGRIHDTLNTGSIPANAKLLEDGTAKLLEDGTFKLLE